MAELIDFILQRGDLAHLSLFLWASGSSALLFRSFKESSAANRRFEIFIRELIRFNNRQMSDVEEEYNE